MISLLSNILYLLVCLNLLPSSDGFLIQKYKRIYSSLASSVETVKDIPDFEWIKGCKLDVVFDGFGVKNMTCGIILQDNFAVEFTNGISSKKPGFWRAIKYDDGRETLEATHPVISEYMLFFDIWEDSILWRGNLNKASMTIEEGTVITNKKRFGIFPFTEVLATFTAKILRSNENLPEVELPSFKAQRFLPPDDFSNPNDMKRYPELFDPEFVEWWFAVEDALAKGESAPQRPKPYFVPKLQSDTASSSNFVAPGNPLARSDDDIMRDGKLRQRRGPTGKKL